MTDIRIDPAVRQKRMEQMQELYDLALANNDMCKEELYTLIKKITNENKQEIENQAIDYIYTALEQVMVITLQEARKIYKKLKDNKRISIEELFYKADEKTLDERVRERIEQDWDTLTLLYYLGVILDTETFQIIHQTIKSKVNIDYIVGLTNQRNTINTNKDLDINIVATRSRQIFCAVARFVRLFSLILHK